MKYGSKQGYFLTEASRTTLYDESAVSHTSIMKLTRRYLPLHNMNRKLLSTTARTHASPIQSASRASARVAVIGLGYVGLPLALTIDRYGYEVVGYDIDTNKTNAVNKRRAEFLSPSESELLRESELRTGAHPRILEGNDIFVICVPTPVNGRKKPDLTPLRSAAHAVGVALRPGALVIVESTVNPGCCENDVLPVLEAASGLRAGHDFSFAHCPERVNPGDAHFGVHNIPRVVGATDRAGLRRAVAFYESVIDAQIMPMGNIREAEAVKMVENTFRDINIAFVNELALAFERVGIDAVNVIKGASTKPFGFMPHYPSCGVGGHCIPVDPYYLIEYGKRNGFTHRLLMTARRVNESMPHHTVDLVEQALTENGRALSGATVAVLGLAYKRGISDLRESPARTIIDDLQKRGATVRSFDPHVPTRSTVASLDDALDGSDAVIVATDHDEFCTLTPDDLDRYGVHIIIDGKNCLDTEAFRAAAGITYHGIGRI